MSDLPTIDTYGLDSPPIHLEGWHVCMHCFPRRWVHVTKEDEHEAEHHGDLFGGAECSRCGVELGDHRESSLACHEYVADESGETEIQNGDG